MIHIDGRMGEGGGQVLRASLALSLATGKPFTIENIRGGRPKPGLLRQHFAAVNAAAEVGGAETVGVEMGSSRIEFHPSEVRGGDYTFSIGSAGSTTLVMQTILPALVLADEPSHVTVEGGTHNPAAPSATFIEATFLPSMRAMGANIGFDLDRMGFMPAGGGKISFSVHPPEKWKRIDLTEEISHAIVNAKAYVSQIPASVGNRELRVLVDALDIPDESTEIVEVADSIGPGNALEVAVASGHNTEIVTGFGQRRLSAETVAKRVVREVKRLAKARVPVGEHLADQVIVPMAIGAGGSFLTLPPSRHLKTVVDVARKFLDVDIQLKPTDGIGWEVNVRNTLNEEYRR